MQGCPWWTMVSLYLWACAGLLSLSPEGQKWQGFIQRGTIVKNGTFFSKGHSFFLNNHVYEKRVGYQYSTHRGTKLRTGKIVPLGALFRYPFLCQNSTPRRTKLQIAPLGVLFRHPFFLSGATHIWSLGTRFSLEPFLESGGRSNKKKLENVILFFQSTRSTPDMPDKSGENRKCPAKGYC